MNSPTANDRLEIEVQDFGPIVHAKIDLRPMMVFIGPSNTGKSYLAILLYALHRFFSGGITGIREWHRFGSKLRSYDAHDLSQETLAAFDLLEKEIADAGTINEGSSITLPERIIELLRSEFDNLDVMLRAEIRRCFGLDDAAGLTRKGCARTRITVRHGSSDDASVLEHLLVLGAEKTKLQTSIPGRIPVSSEDWTDLRLLLQGILIASGRAGGNVLPSEYLQVIQHLMDYSIPRMATGLNLPAFYLPADRTGVMHAHSALVSAMIDNAPLGRLQTVGPTPMFSGVFADFLRQLIQVDRVPRKADAASLVAGQDVSRGIEQNILRGTVRVERSELINYPHFTYRPDRWKENLPLMHASSMVSELAPVVLYLRHLVRPGNVLIIEEPESHLHPAMQVELTRQLAKLVQAGYRVIITTHSEWILEELANVVQRSQLPPEELSTVSVSDAALTADQVGVWLFRPKARPRGSEVVQITLDDSGLYPSDFDDVAMALGNDSAKIFNRIGE